MSLLEKLCDLASTAPVLADPEDDVHEDTRAKVLEDFTEDYEEVGVGRIRRHQPLSIRDPKYAGTKISRKELEKLQFGDSDTESSCDEDDQDEEALAHSSEVSAAESGAEDDTEEDAEDDVELEDEEEEDEEEEEAVKSEVEEPESAEEEDRCQEQSDLEDTVVQKFSAVDVTDEVQKGKAVQSQLQLWDSLLELRIQLQKLLVLANRFPRHDRYGEFRRSLLSQDRKRGRLLGAAAKNVETAFLELLELREKMIDSHPEIGSQLRSTRSGEAAEQKESDDEEIPSDTEDEKDDGEEEGGDGGDEDDAEEQRPRKKRRIFDAVADVESFHRDFVPVRNAIVEKWYERTRLASGKVGKGFSAFEQSPLKQIEHVLADERRLILRTQTKRSAYKILGAAPDDGDEEQVASMGTREINEEIFDDDDFYHHLLRELIERKTANVDNPVALSRQWLEIQKLRSKVKRKVDTKASKGRRTRYDVIPKLVNFMAPVDTATYSEEARTELFGSLFGQRKYAGQPTTR